VRLVFNKNDNELFLFVSVDRHFRTDVQFYKFLEVHRRAQVLSGNSIDMLGNVDSLLRDEGI